jgi:hypothetical protein
MQFRFKRQSSPEALDVPRLASRQTSNESLMSTQSMHHQQDRHEPMGAQHRPSQHHLQTAVHPFQTHASPSLSITSSHDGLMEGRLNKMLEQRTAHGLSAQSDLSSARRQQALHSLPQQPKELAGRGSMTSSSSSLPSSVNSDTRQQDSNQPPGGMPYRRPAYMMVMGSDMVLEQNSKYEICCSHPIVYPAPVLRRLLSQRRTLRH